MIDSENPFQAPIESGPVSTNKSINWRAFLSLNTGLVVALVTFILVSIAWANFETTTLDQPLGSRRYATYDHEVTHHFYPTAGLVVLFLIFAVPNFILFAIQLVRRLPKQ